MRHQVLSGKSFQGALLGEPGPLWVKKISRETAGELGPLWIKKGNDLVVESPVTVVTAVEDLVNNAAENCVLHCCKNKSERDKR